MRERAYFTDEVRGGFKPFLTDLWALRPNPSDRRPVTAKTLRWQAKRTVACTWSILDSMPLWSAPAWAACWPRALSDFYAVVTALERDAFPQSDNPRKGVPQGRPCAWPAGARPNCPW